MSARQRKRRRRRRVFLLALTLGMVPLISGIFDSSAISASVFKSPEQAAPASPEIVSTIEDEFAPEESAVAALPPQAETVSGASVGLEFSSAGFPELNSLAKFEEEDRGKYVTSDQKRWSGLLHARARAPALCSKAFEEVYGSLGCNRCSGAEHGPSSCPCELFDAGAGRSCRCNQSLLSRGLLVQDCHCGCGG